MANYNFMENPIYQTLIRALDNNDPVNAETILNPVIETLINNTQAVKLSTDHHQSDNSKHITATERQKLSGIDEGANKYTHPTSGVSAGTYRSVTVNTGGHVTSGSNPTTISGYGLTDAYTKTEVDTKITAHTGSTSPHVSTTDRTNWNDANSKKHEHSNKAVLDGITSTKISNWDNASTNNHVHSNKTVLDGVTSTKITNWDNASTNSHTHNNKSLLDGVTSAKVTNWDNAFTNNHTHNNKSLLDGISSAKISSWDSASTNNHTHSNKNVLDSVSQTKINTWDGYEQKINNVNDKLAGKYNAATGTGYIHDPSGLLIQWGRATAIHKSAGNVIQEYVNFPITYDYSPSIDLTLITSAPSYYQIGLYSIKTTSFAAVTYRSTATNGDYFWCAKGYKKYT